MRKGAIQRVAVTCVLAAAALLIGCCHSTRPNGTPPDAARPAGPPPDASVLLAAHNADVRRLEALQAGVIVVVTATNKDGKTEESQAEANLQFVRPRRVALRIDKVSQTYFWLGSSDDRYWWLDLSTDGKHLALVGRHDRATPATAAEFGVPVHPLDLVDLIGLLPIDTNAPGAWSADGRHAVVEIAPRGPGWGARKFYFDPRTNELRRVDVLDAAGSLAARADLDVTREVEVVGDPGAGAKIPTRVAIELPTIHARVHLELHTLKNPGVQKIKPVNFEYDRLRAIHRVDREVDLDARGGGT